LLLFLLVISFVSYFLLVKRVRFVTFCYFFIGCNFDKLFFTVEKGQGEGFYSLCNRGLERVQVDFFLTFFTVEGEGGGS
jgi:hypothetical protein